MWENVNVCRLNAVLTFECLSLWAFLSTGLQLYVKVSTPMLKECNDEAVPKTLLTCNSCAVGIQMPEALHMTPLVLCNDCTKSCLLADVQCR